MLWKLIFYKKEKIEVFLVVNYFPIVEQDFFEICNLAKYPIQDYYGKL